MKLTDNGRGQFQNVFTLDEILDQLYPVLLVCLRYYKSSQISYEDMVGLAPLIANQILVLELHDSDKQDHVVKTMQLVIGTNYGVPVRLQHEQSEKIENFVRVFLTAIDRFQRNRNGDFVLSKPRIRYIMRISGGDYSKENIDRMVGWTALENILPIPEQAWDITLKRFPVPKELVEGRYNFLGKHKDTEYGIIPISNTDPNKDDVIIWVVNQEMFEIERALVNFDGLLPTEDEIFDVNWLTT